jgi:hypothetical protein
MMVGTAREERAFAHPTRSRLSILRTAIVGWAKRSVPTTSDYDTFTPSRATTRKAGFSVPSSCVFNS